MTSQIRRLRFGRQSSGVQQFTGERYIPAVSGAIQYEHYHRYLFAAPICEGKDILDIASGEGYGADVLAQVARTVVGVDVDAEAVGAARNRYVRDNLRFEQGSATLIPLPDASVDVVTSFETLEHFREHEQFMREVCRVLRPNGLLIVSTPNRPVYSPPGAMPNEYHVRELDRAEFVQFLGVGFTNINLYVQKASAGSIIFHEEHGAARDVSLWTEVDAGTYERTSTIPGAVYFVALATNGELPAIEGTILDCSHSFQEYDRVRNEQVGQQAGDIARLTFETMQRADEIGRLTAETVRLTEAVVKRDADIGQLTSETVRLNAVIVERNQELERVAAEQRQRDAELACQQQALATLADAQTPRHLVETLTQQMETFSARLKTMSSPATEATGAGPDLDDPLEADTVHALRTQNRALHAEIESLRASFSWRVTRPVRLISTRLLRPAKARASVLLGRAPRQPAAANRSARIAMALPANWRDVPFVPFEKPLRTRVTIAMIASREATTLDASLRMLSATLKSADTEVIVISDAESPVAAQRGVQVRHAPDATMHITGVRDRIGEVEGEYLVLMSDRLAAHPGWLDAMLELFDRFPDAGAVTGLLLDEKGDVIAAGSGVSSDGRLVANASGSAADDSRVASVARVSAASPGILMVRASLWRQLSPQLIAGAPFEAGIASLALLLASEAIHTYCQPFARFSFVSDAARIPAPSRDAWDNAYQGWQLRDRFETVFANYAGTTDVLPLATRPKIVIVDAFVPKPDQDSGSADLFWYMRIFQAFGYEVCFIAAFEQVEPQPYADLLRGWGFRVLIANGMISLQEITTREAVTANLVMLQRISVASHLVDTVRRTAPRAKLVFSTVDLHYLREERAAIVERSASALSHALEVRRAELHAIGVADATTVVSHVERDIVKRLMPAANVHRIPIPRIPTRAPTSFEARRGVVFIGGFAHQPNIDAVKYLVGEIWPLVRRRLPDIELQVVGSNVTPDIAALDAPQDGVRIVGFVEDLSSILDHVRLSVAPLRFGAGVKGKVVSSLLHGVPCVLSKVASEGMGLVTGEHILEGDTPQQLADEIVRLHEDAELWQRLADAGFQAALSEFSVRTVAECFRTMLESIGLGKTVDETGLRFLPQ
ncbi:methyltransferase domain-containing protein [Paraburkholderia panacisoli]|uniref:Methyltransferase domain-containing protein n=1 Tax=Paraburkholderia panacisoli TaxID=2603818 RepID=A0A5B0GGU2_9BURK|nr:methyltransferase domain-containing protein [Paraburkholderia panacisoli]KAA1002566.1 methyltransferase domain-containing protein [Paraburkholderia panacisoli]